MMIRYGFASFQPLCRAQAWAVECLISVHCASGDFRWGIAALALRSFAALRIVAEKRLASLARYVMGRAWRGARLVAGATDADTMVAAGHG
jgi:hypothetical protein